MSKVENSESNTFVVGISTMLAFTVGAQEVIILTPLICGLQYSTAPGLLRSTFRPGALKVVLLMCAFINSVLTDMGISATGCVSA
jgi:hypothetical protein